MFRMGFWSRVLNGFLAPRARGFAPLPPCPISWQPDSLAPVFWGYRDYLAQFPGQLVPAVVVPGSVVTGEFPTHRVRVFFPSLDGSPDSAAILSNCGRYPVIVFAHGNCNEDEANQNPEYLLWFELPAQLARCGYVVVVPELPEIAAGVPPETADDDLAVLGGFVSWIRTSWEYRETVLPAPATGIAAHSWGAGLSARLVGNGEGEIAAFATFSGKEIDEIFQLIESVPIPKLHTWGSDQATDGLTELRSEEWDALPRPKHKAVLKGIGHFDYLPAGRSACEDADGSSRGPCALTPELAAELLMMFFGRYLRPEGAPDLRTRIASSLVPPTQSEFQAALSPDQEFYAGGFLGAFESIDSGHGSACQVALTWDTGPGDSGSRTTP